MNDDQGAAASVRATSLGPQDIFLLDQWARQLQEAFTETPYLVDEVPQ